MSKSPLKPWRALSDCETIRALKTAWIGTFQQHLCLHHDKQHFADITNMIYQGLTLHLCCCGTEYGLEAHGAEAPPHPMITRDSARCSRPVDFSPSVSDWTLLQMVQPWKSGRGWLASQTRSLLLAGLWESLEMKYKALASEIVVLCALDWRENCRRLTCRWWSWTAVVNRLDGGEQKKPRFRKTAGPGHQDSQHLSQCLPLKIKSHKNIFVFWTKAFSALLMFFFSLFLPLGVFFSQFVSPVLCPSNN